MGDMATAQAQLVALPSPNRGRPLSFQQLLSASYVSSAALGTGNTAVNTMGRELALRELTF